MDELNSFISDAAYPMEQLSVPPNRIRFGALSQLLPIEFGGRESAFMAQCLLSLCSESGRWIGVTPHKLEDELSLALGDHFKPKGREDAYRQIDFEMSHIFYAGLKQLEQHAMIRVESHDKFEVVYPKECFVSKLLAWYILPMNVAQVDD